MKSKEKSLKDYINREEDVKRISILASPGDYSKAKELQKKINAKSLNQMMLALINKAHEEEFGNQE